MPKVLFLLAVPPPIHGASVMGKYIQDSKVINESYQISYINLNTSTSVEEIGGAGLRKYFRIIGLLFKVFIQLIRLRPHFTYMTPTAGGMGFYKDWPLAMLCKLFSNRFIIHCHNKGVVNFQSNALDDWLYRRFFHKTDVILLAKELFSDVSKYVSKERLYICPNGIPDPEPNLKFKRLGKTEPLKILFLSNLIREKGIFDLLHAIALIKNESIPIHCTIIGGEGDVSKQELLNEVSELNLDKEITYLGKKYGKEKHEIIQASDVFVFPTYYRKECFPLVILEAMAFGLPVITTDEGGIRSIINNRINGLIVDSNAPGKLAIAIKELAENEELRLFLSQSARKDFTQNFTLEKFEENFLNSINRIIKTNYQV
ncbi:glycosyltransferase family 4 protein [Algoriphagus halophytocola]|uniref:Glycosyltransferase family 4 protein n=1 Tax=Algoriphagus halophytocola TaxID=2991499 RepID=A0ABY6MGY8_9BACT|nr:MULTISPECIES: glycosyltransferase family 4 protein [unclassified Algoriphagus]UZD23052.1 glycosyltransferase family 4 protein [Algoriphagus sp. TR-M5]WBL44344.1 glycosyltransferase family 4 protein [Algoriphagus sp. TR-M9]